MRARAGSGRTHAGVTFGGPGLPGPLRSTEIEAPAAGALSTASTAPETDRMDGSAPALPGLEYTIERRARLGVLRHRHFRNVWAGAMISNIGGWMEGVGIQWIMTQATLAATWVQAGRPSALTMMGVLAATQLGPCAALGLVGGIVADRVNRKRLLLITQSIMMLIAASLAISSFLTGALPPVWLLLTLSLLQGITLAFNTPAWQVLTPRLVPRDELTNAIALNGLQFNLARVAGPALAGALMAKYSATILFAVNTFTFLFVLAAIASTPDAPAPPRERRHVFHETAEALSFMFHRRGPRAVFLATVTFSILAAPLMRMLPLFAHDVYSSQDPLLKWITRLPIAGPGEPREMIFGWLLAVMGTGAVFGAIAIRWIPRWYPKHHFIPLSILLGGLTIVAFSATRSLATASVFLFLCGIAWLWAFNSCMAALQLLVPDEMRGRVMSANNMAVFGAMPVGAFLASQIGDLAGAGAAPGVSTQIGVGTLGAVLTVAGMVMLIWRTPEVDGLAPGDPGFQRRPSLLDGITARAHRPTPPQTAGSESLQERSASSAL